MKIKFLEDEQPNKLDVNFSTIITDQLDESIVAKGLRDGNLIEKIKPFMFDSLKRSNRFESIISCIRSFGISNEEDWAFMSQLEDRDLLCALIQSVNKYSRSKLGTLIAKNDYAVPLMFSKYKPACNDIPVENELCFELLDTELCLTTRTLAVVSGTQSASFCGKSTLIPYLFEGLHPEYSVLRSSIYSKWQKNNVDVLCNGETCSKWIVADFHSHVESSQAKNLLKAMLTKSSLHLLNVTLDDFDNSTGEFSAELREIVEWQMINTTSTVILIIRDYTQKGKSKLEKISNQLFQKISTKRLYLMRLEDISKEDPNRPFRIKKIMDELNKIIASNEFKSTPIHSIRDIQRTFYLLNENISFNFHTSNRFGETKLEEIFEVISLNFLKSCIYSI